MLAIVGSCDIFSFAVIVAQVRRRGVDSRVALCLEWRLRQTQVWSVPVPPVLYKDTFAVCSAQIRVILLGCNEILCSGEF